jgi:hypothetical protein
LYLIEELRMLPNTFIDVCNDAILRIGVGIAHATMSFGATDFPSDNGVHFRNQLYKYPYSYFQTIFHLLEPESKDEWATYNRQHVLNLDSIHLVKCVGLSHFHAEGRKLFNLLEDAQKHFFPGRTPNSVEAALSHTRKMFDWLLGIYSFPPTVGQNWYQLLVKGGDFPAFVKQSKDTLYSEIAFALTLNPSDAKNADCWSGLAHMADWYAYNIDGNEWNAICQRSFAEYSQRVKPLPSTK